MTIDIFKASHEMQARSLRLQHLAILCALFASPDEVATFPELIERTGFPRPTIDEATVVLSNAGFVVREAGAAGGSSANRRPTKAALTVAGHKLVDRFVPAPTTPAGVLDLNRQPGIPLDQWRDQAAAKREAARRSSSPTDH